MIAETSAGVQHWLLDLAEFEFRDTWFYMPPAKREELPADVRAECYRRYAKGSPQSAPVAIRAIQTAADVPTSALTFPHVWVGEIEINLTSTDFVKGVIGKLANVLVYGPSGDGKTFWTMDLLWHIALGITWRDRRAREEALCVYVAAEAGASIARRFVALREQCLPADHEGHIPLAVITRGANLLHRAEVDALIAELRTIVDEAGMPLGVVVFDTLSRSTPGGDENSAEDMTRTIAAADRIRGELRATVVFVHHSGKDTGKGARGHSSLYAAADTVICVQDKCATIEKSRDGSSGEQFPFALDVVDLGHDGDGDPVTTCIVRHLNSGHAASKAVRLTDAEKIALDALKNAIADSGEELPTTSSIPGGRRGVRLDTWRGVFYRQYGEDEDRSNEAAKKAFKRAREGLLGDKLIGISSPWVWLW